MKTYVLKRLWIALCLYGISLSMHAAPLDSIAYFFQYQRSTLQEKLYLTTDRPYYEAGDTIWFRGTLVSADNLSFVVKSNYIYVELLNRSDQLVMRRKVQREGLCFEHCLPLLPALSSGEYTLRAYTSWMRNFPYDFFFNRKLTIVNRNEKPVEDPVITPDFGITFFPEGGAWLNGTSQRIAFKAENNAGLPQEVEGRITDSEGKVYATFKSEHDGMGVFELTAETTQHTLKAEVTATDKEGKIQLNSDLSPMQKTVPLPKVQDWGFGISITQQTQERLTYRIDMARSDVDPNFSVFGPDSLLLFVHGGARITAFRKAAPGAGHIDLQHCKDGINHILLCLPDGTPVSRRLFFHQNNQRKTQGEIVPEWKPNEPRDPVLMNISLYDADGKPLRGDFCMSVTDATYINHRFDPHRDHIVSNMLLCGDLKGYIHQPAWYLTDSIDQQTRQQALDLLMMTHGWSRFDTDTIVRHPQREFPEPLEEREWVSGKILHLKKKDLEKNIAISIVDTAGHSFGNGRLDDEGRFFIGDLNYPDGAVLNVRVLSTGKNPQFIFDPMTFPEASHKEPFKTDFATYITEASEKELMIGRDGMRTMLLDNIEIVDQRKSQSKHFKAIGAERWHNTEYLEANYDLYQYNTALLLVNQMIENEWSMYLSPLEEVWEDESEEESEVKASSWGTLGTFVIGEDIYTNVNSAIGILERTKAVDIERIEIIDKQQNVLDPMSGKAALVVILKPGSKIITGTEDNRFTTHRTFGYTPGQYFYHPIYKTPEQRNWPEPDLRKTLYWEASFQTDKEGKALLGFYNSDHVGARHILIEGVTFDGRPVHIEKIIDR